jgi:hypothetical protein
MNFTQIKKLTVLPTECDCEKCSLMCHAPCCGTPDDMEILMNTGYGNRLIYDGLPGGEKMLKPAVKGYEGKNSPWQTFSKEGCTFWKEKKCELHSLGLKPTQGKLVIHDQTEEDQHDIAEFIEDSWRTEKAKKTIKRWKEINQNEKN